MDYPLNQRALTSLVPAATVSAEERFTADCVVPDSLPDAAVLLFAAGDLCLWRVDLSEGAAEVEGELRGDLVCGGEDGGVFSFPVSMPVLFRLRDAQLSPTQSPVLTFTVTELTPQLMNSRKTRLSARVRAELTGYDARERLLTEAAEDASVCQKRETVRFEHITDVTEQVFSAEGRIPLRMGSPDAERPLAARSSVVVTELQNLGPKLIVQGRVSTALLYADPAQGSVISETVQTPFSQLVDAPSGEEIVSAQVQVHLTSASVRLLPEERIAETELHLVAQAVCRSAVQAEVLTDAYSNRTLLALETEPLTLRTGASTEQQHLRAEADVPCDTQGVTVVSVHAALRGREAAEVTLLRRDEAGRYSALRQILRFEPLTDGRVIAVTPEEAAVSPTAEGLRISLPLTREVEREEVQTITHVTAIAGDQPNEAALTMPSVTLMKTVPDADLWPLAKSHGSTVEAIRAANPDEDSEPRPFLIIPAVR